MALTTTAILMWWTFIPFAIYKVFRGRSFDFDFDELDEEGKKYSNKQGLVYHYWGDSRYQGWMAAIKTNIRDLFVGGLGFIPWLILNVLYWPSWAISILILPLTLTWNLFTPWNEKQMESPLLWFSKAVEGGYSEDFPDYVYTNRFMLPDATAFREAEIAEIMEDIAKKEEKDNKKNKD
jgi:hypothetical protein